MFRKLSLLLGWLILPFIFIGCGDPEYFNQLGEPLAVAPTTVLSMKLPSCTEGELAQLETSPAFQIMRHPRELDLAVISAGACPVCFTSLEKLVQLETVSVSTGPEIESYRLGTEQETSGFQEPAEPSNTEQSQGPRISSYNGRNSILPNGDDPLPLDNRMIHSSTSSGSPSGNSEY